MSLRTLSTELYLDLDLEAVLMTEGNENINLSTVLHWRSPILHEPIGQIHASFLKNHKCKLILN